MVKTSWLAFLPLIIFVALVAGFALALKPSAVQSPKFAQHVGETAPLTELPALGKSPAGFATMKLQGKPYIVNFFASWCAPCRAEHPGLLQLAKSGVPIIGVAYEDKEPAVTEFLGKEGNPFAVVADDTTGRTGIDWGLTGVPETFIVDAHGVIRFHEAGPLTDDKIAKEFLPAWDKVKE